MRSRILGYASLGVAILAGAGCSRFHDKPKGNAADGRELKLVEQMGEEAEEEISRFEKSRGNSEAKDNPSRKWAEIFWTYHEVHPGTAASAQAANYACMGWNYSGQQDASLAKMDTMSANDTAWSKVGPCFEHAAGLAHQYTRFEKKIEAVLRENKGSETRAALELELGNAYQEQEDLEHAKAAFRAAARAAPESNYARDALGNIHEIEALGIGQPAPLFSAAALDGTRLSLDDLRGKILLLNFWGTY